MPAETFNFVVLAVAFCVMITDWGCVLISCWYKHVTSSNVLLSIMTARQLICPIGTALFDPKCLLRRCVRVDAAAYSYANMNPGAHSICDLIACSRCVV